MDSYLAFEEHQPLRRKRKSRRQGHERRCGKLSRHVHVRRRPSLLAGDFDCGEGMIDETGIELVTL
jgi:hypothetical protein